MSFIDTHAHLYGEDFETDLLDVIERARLAGAYKIFLPSTDLPSAQMVAHLSKRFSGLFYPMIGLHPEDLPENYLEILQQMELELKEPNTFIGIGEVGLDFYWNATRVQDQMRAFDIQIGWSERFGLPLMIHARSAHKELMQCLQPYRNCGISGVFHCFTGTREEAADLLDFDHFMLGIGGVVTFKKSCLSEVLKSVPLSRLVLETDAPYMAPVPYRGKRNETSFLPAIIQKLAEIYGTSTKEVSRITSENALKTFPLAQ